MGEAEGICATDNYTLLSSLAEKLRVNAAEEYSVFLQSFCAVFRGVGLLPLPALRTMSCLCPCLHGFLPIYRCVMLRPTRTCCCLLA